MRESKGATMGQYDRHVFVCTSGETCPVQGDTEKYVKILRAGVQNANRQGDVRVNKSGCFSQCGHGPMIVVYPENVWYAGVRESDLEEILASHIVGGCVLTCLEHTWQFDLKTGAPVGEAEEGLKGYRLREEQGEIYVALD